MRRAPRIHFILLFFVLLPSFGADAESTPLLTVGEASIHVYAQQGEESEIVARVEKGDKLRLLARAIGKGSWYMVKTARGTVGWVRSSDVSESQQLERTFEETVSLPPPAPAANDIATASTASLRSETVSVEMNGASVVVPVVLNRSMKTYMIMDTGSSFTVVTPAVAKKLGLRSGSRVSVVTANGTIVVPLARLESLKVGSAEVHGLLVTVQNFSPDSRIEGLLGLNFLSRFHSSIDSQRQALILAPR